VDGPGQLRLAAIHAVQQKLFHSGTVVRQKLKQSTMIGGLVRVVALKRLRFGKKFQHIFDLVWSQLPVTEIIAGTFRTACILYTFLQYLKRFLRYFKKLFLKNFVRCYGFLKRLDLGQITLPFFVFFSYCWESNLVSPGQHSRGNVSAKLGEGFFFLDISNPCISNTVRDIKTNMEVLGCLRPHFFM